MTTEIIYLIGSIVLLAIAFAMEKYTKKKFPELFEEDEKNS